MEPLLKIATAWLALITGTLSGAGSAIPEDLRLARLIAIAFALRALSKFRAGALVDILGVAACGTCGIRHQ